MNYHNKEKENVQELFEGKGKKNSSTLKRIIFSRAKLKRNNVAHAL
jgi:hypothetical protein